jgi:hypothetical protein
MLSNVYLWIALGIIAASGVVYWRGDAHGYGRCESAHAEAQAKQTEKVRKSDAKRDREKPVTADRDKLLDWLFQYGSQ